MGFYQNWKGNNTSGGDTLSSMSTFNIVISSETFDFFPFERSLELFVFVVYV